MVPYLNFVELVVSNDLLTLAPRRLRAFKADDVIDYTTGIINCGGIEIALDPRAGRICEPSLSGFTSTCTI